MVSKVCGMGVLMVLAGTAGAEIIVTPTFVKSFEVGVPTFSERASPLACYSNIDTFKGTVNINGGATNLSGNVMTRMVVDDLNIAGGPNTLTKLTFSVASLNESNTSARARIRLYADDNDGAPGTLIAGFTTTTFTFGPNSVSLYSITIPATAVPGKVWAGILFDNNGGLTGAGTAQLNNVGQGVFDPPEVGSSVDLYFRTSTSGSFLNSNPAGGVFSGGGAGPIGNFGWELIPAPGALAALGLGGLAAARRRRA